MTLVQNGGTLAQLRRVNAYPGLMIDADAWRDAHEYHRDVVRLHHLALHGWGIVQGLEVSLATGTDNTLRIQPGLAIDPAGNLIVVGQPQTYRLMSDERGPVYVVLQFTELLAAQGNNGAGRGQPTRVVEAYRVQERDQLPTDAYVELVRVDFDPALGAVREPPDPVRPAANELDRRGRVQVGASASPDGGLPPPPPPMSPGAQREDLLAPQIESLAAQVAALGHRIEDGQAADARPHLPPAPSPSPDGEPELEALRQRVQTLAQDVESLGFRVEAVAAHQADAPPPAPPSPPPPPAPMLGVRLRVALVEHGSPGWDQHHQGLRLLGRELSLAGEPRIVVDDKPVALAEADGVDVLYLCGVAAFSLTQADLHAIDGLLQRGGVVIGEGCGAGPKAEAGAREFAMAFVDLAQRLDHQLARLDREHPLLTARYVFGDPPPGARGSPRVLEAGGLVYSDADYGCAWQGGPADRPLSRASIRDAIEFGANLAVYRQGGPVSGALLSG
jgi:hypothetical protein